MPKIAGWQQPDIQSMSAEQLNNHLEQMRAIGEAYRTVWATGQWPLPAERLGVWWNLTTPDFIAWQSFRPDKEMLVSDMMAEGIANPPDYSIVRSVCQDDINIHPFPGGCLFEQVLRFVKTDGTEVRIPGLHIFYADAEGKIMRTHEYYDFSIARDAGIAM